MTLPQLLRAVKERLERASGDTIFTDYAAFQAYLAKLARICEVQAEALEHYAKLDDWKMLPMPAREAIEQADAIASGGGEA